MIFFFTSPTVLETFCIGKRESNQEIKTETGEFIEILVLDYNAFSARS